MLKEVIILTAHGSPLGHARKNLILLKKYFLKKSASKQNIVICHAFLQFNKPFLRDVLLKVIKLIKPENIKQILILPVFISHGRHTLRDIPRISCLVKKRYKGLKIKIAEPLGEGKDFILLLYKRYKKIS